MEAARMIVPLRELSISDIPRVGGKNASLGEMLKSLGPLGVRVPDGFAIVADAFRWHLRQAGLEDWIYGRLDDADLGNPKQLSLVAAEIRTRIKDAVLPKPLMTQIAEAYGAMGTPEQPWVDVAVRSSSTAEDLPTASFAGQHESFLNVRGLDALDRAVRACMASLFTDRAIVYRINNNFDHRSMALSVGVQRMVRSDLACAGTMFTLDTETGFRGVVMIDAAWGLGETIVQGRVSPDEYWVHKATAKAGFKSLIRKELGEKARKLVYESGGVDRTRDLREIAVPEADRERFCLSDDEAMELARWAIAIEDHYSRTLGTPVPMDVEWAKDGVSGKLFIVQARPETVHSRGSCRELEVYSLQGTGKLLLTGKSVGCRINAGPVRIVRSPAELGAFREGEVLVAAMTDPDWEPVLRKAAAVVTDRGGRTCHAAIVSREMGLPCVVGTAAGTGLLRDGQIVTVSCAQGEVGRVYEGRLAFSRTSVDPKTLPEPRVPLMLNLADPGQAFRLCQLPSAGVGLLRLEFLISNWIGVHPMALAHPERVRDAGVLSQIRAKARSHASLSEFFIERLAAGIGQIGAAFHPRPVIVRFSDFKTNEYAKLLGGEAFEPVEENPMIGFRGASRYYDDRYRDGFALECAAVKRVRETMGLSNVIVMIPFCRTLGEASSVLAEMSRHGLRRGEKEMQVYVMCEIPNNVVLADRFADLFDGFSIGSNDLTQLTLGIDRDSELLTHLFDERDPGVKKLIESVIIAAHAKGRKVGICGEAPSNYPDFAQWLAELGIDSMSLNPDSLAGVASRLARPPARLPETAAI
jgi:pyruvate,water dikinase